MARLGLKAWRTAAVVPSQRDHDREDEFPNGHIDAGSLIHPVTAEALVAALKREADVRRRAPMALRVLAEYVNALETMGAWGWAIRHRSEAPLMIDAFLSYSR